MRLCLIMAVLIGAALLHRPAAAEPQITTVIVRSEPGPALWKATRDGATVWILAAPYETPEGLSWDQQRVRRILRTAKALILPVQAWSDSAGEKRWREQSLLKGQRLRDVVSPETYARFQAAVAREGVTPMRDYEGLAPVRAGSNFYDRFRHDHHIRNLDVLDAVNLLAVQARAPVQQASFARSNFITDQWLTMNAAQNEACLTEFLDAADYDLTTLPQAAQAWAQADVTTLLATYRAPAGQACDMALPAWRAAYDNDYVGGMARAIDAALKTPGETLAVVGLPEFFSANGVLDRLKAAGTQVTAPAQ
ncbi:MAG TPA: TraB/GumN family protein [Asticcacaulis sp.]|nr:TraB/GumN family protein [Asticcacaulis sp.]